MNFKLCNQLALMKNHRAGQWRMQGSRLIIEFPGVRALQPITLLGNMATYELFKLLLSSKWQNRWHQLKNLNEYFTKSFESE